MPKRTLASARGAHSDKAQGINPNKRLVGMNIRTVPQRMTAQAEPSGPGEEPEEEPAEEEPEEESEEEPAAKKRKTTKAAGGKRKRASNDEDENEDEDEEEAEEESEAERPKKKAKPAANKKAGKGKGKSPKKKKKASNKAKEPEEPEEPYNPNQLWAVRDIISQRTTSEGVLQYYVDWEPTNGRKWDPTWVSPDTLFCFVLFSYAVY